MRSLNRAAIFQSVAYRLSDVFRSRVDKENAKFYELVKSVRAHFVSSGSGWEGGEGGAQQGSLVEKLCRSLVRTRGTVRTKTELAEDH